MRNVSKDSEQYKLYKQNKQNQEYDMYKIIDFRHQNLFWVFYNSRGWTLVKKQNNPENNRLNHQKRIQDVAQKASQQVIQQVQQAISNQQQLEPNVLKDQISQMSSQIAQLLKQVDEQKENLKLNTDNLAHVIDKRLSITENQVQQLIPRSNSAQQESEKMFDRFRQQMSFKYFK